MATVTNRLIELFRNLKSDAVPNPPRQENEENSSTNQDAPAPPLPNEHPEKAKEESDEEIVFENEDFVKDEKKSKFNIPFKSKKKKGRDPMDPKDPKSKHKKEGSYSSVNTQATGSVFNIVNSNRVQFGSNNVYYMSSSKKSQKVDDEDEDHVEKDNLIILLMESEIQPTHKYVDFIAKNLGMNWKSIYITMGYLKGRIETLVAEKGITEARYFLLQDWIDNEDDPSLGRLATILWEEGERQIVKELSLIYKENKK